jgi:DNA-binding NarL/FixJ family response regulator
VNILLIPRRLTESEPAATPLVEDDDLISHGATFGGGGMPRCRILLADGHVLRLGVLDRLLGETPGVEIVARADTGLEALSLAQTHQPDLIIMNLEMPGISGLEATHQLTTEPWAPRIVLTSFRDEPEYYQAAEAAGADGFVLDQEVGTRLLPLIRSLLEADSRPQSD